MSSYFSGRLKTLTPYTPGEQPQDQKYIKLNTNESPFPPSEKAVELASEAAKKLQLYSDPEVKLLVEKATEVFGVSKDEIIFTNGSDEVLNFAFMAFCDDDTPAVFADITYGFYPVFAEINHLPYKILPLDADFNLNVDDYINENGTVFIANPNAPTGKALPVSEIERLLTANKDRVVVIDEAYVDFAEDSCVRLIHKYPNLLVTQTFSKSRSMAGARLGFGIACKELIQDLNTVKYSTNPYNINSMTMAAGIGALSDEAYTKRNCETIKENRAFTARELEKRGFTVLPSSTNFVFAKSDKVSGKDIYLKLKEKGVLIRHFETDRLKDYNRITIGSKEQMEIFLEKIDEILEEA